MASIKKIVLSLLPESWVNEIYFKGYTDAGNEVVAASYWFSSFKPIFDTLHMMGHNMQDKKTTSVDCVRGDVLTKYPELTKFKDASNH